MLCVNQADREMLLPTEYHQQATCGQNLPNVQASTWVHPRDKRSTPAILKTTTIIQKTWFGFSHYFHLSQVQPCLQSVHLRILHFMISDQTSRTLGPSSREANPGPPLQMGWMTSHGWLRTYYPLASMLTPQWILWKVLTTSTKGMWGTWTQTNPLFRNGRCQVT